MEPTLVDKPQMILLGFSFFGDPFKLSGGWTAENEIGRLWKRFTDYWAQHPAEIKHVKNAAVSFEVHIEHPETAQTGEYEIFVGREVEQLEHVPIELSAKVLPPATYAVFTLRGPQINSFDWPKQIQAWLDQEGYVRPHPYGFQLYDERFKDIQHIGESVLDVYVPITRPVNR
jgi:predicted transcriptional regulator YdeE